MARSIAAGSNAVTIAPGAPRDAVETLRAVLDEEPAHEGAVRALSTLLEKTAQFEELADLLAQQVDRARDRGDAWRGAR